jgi:HlyD family secretion protein
MRSWLKIIVVIIVLAVLAAAGFAWYSRRAAETATAFRTAAITRGDLAATVTATGTIEPEELVDVGAQVAGQIIAFGKDERGKTIDFGSVVKQGMVLARIDDTVYAADLAQAQALLAQAEAGVKRAQADLGQLKAKQVQAQRDWERVKELGPSEAVSKTEYDAAEANHLAAVANVAVGDAEIVQAQRAVDQARASVQRAQRNVDYCVIKSPVDGVIIDRRVNAGQTVVASLNAPSLFLIAKDLTRMQIWVPVNEADIGSIQPGQAVTYTVDAFPGRTFKGRVGKVRLNASMTQNVVTYTVEVETDNPDGKLLPYLTANVLFEITRHNGVLTVPNAALRWTPAEEEVAPEARGAAAQGEAGPRGRGAATQPSPGPGAAQSQPDEDVAWRRGTLWVPDGPYVRPLRVKAGLSDGATTEVAGGGVAEGVEVVIGEMTPQQAAGSAPAGDGTTNPFAPPSFRRRRQSPSTGGSR